jgi:hypothetical protein
VSERGGRLGPLVEVGDSVLVEYRQFLLSYTGGGGEPVAAGGDATVVVGRGCVYFASAGNDHYPDVVLTVWVAEPAPPAGEWDDDVGQATVVFSTPVIRLRSLTAQPGEHELTLPRAGAWQVRAFSTGGWEIWEMGEATFARGIERWAIQLWPAAAAQP